MNNLLSVEPPTFPARPVNGGPLPKALPKPGQWVYEPKYNGWRALVHLPTGRLYNRLGLPVSIAQEFKPALDILCSTLDASAMKWADCEALERRHGLGRGTLIVLDVIPEPDWAEAAYTARRAWFASIIPIHHPDQKPEPSTVYQSPRISATFAMQAWDQLQQINRQWGVDFYEGLVAKRDDSPYPIQRRSPKLEFSGWMKHRWHF